MVGRAGELSNSASTRLAITSAPFSDALTLRDDATVSATAAAELVVQNPSRSASPIYSVMLSCSAVAGEMTQNVPVDKHYDKGNHNEKADTKGNIFGIFDSTLLICYSKNPTRNKCGN